LLESLTCSQFSPPICFGGVVSFGSNILKLMLGPGGTSSRRLINFEGTSTPRRSVSESQSALSSDNSLLLNM
jgi:hypothetical protein